MSKLWLKYVEILIEILFATLLALSTINLHQPHEPTIQMTTVVKPAKGNLFQSPLTISQPSYGCQGWDTHMEFSAKLSNPMGAVLGEYLSEAHVRIIDA